MILCELPPCDDIRQLNGVQCAIKAPLRLGRATFMVGWQMGLSPCLSNVTRLIWIMILRQIFASGVYIIDMRPFYEK